jgi:hypothetical protein
MNYDWDKSDNVNLCLTWMKYAQKALSKLDTIYIYSKHKLHPLLYKAFNDGECVFKSVIRPYCIDQPTVYFTPQHTSPISRHNFWYKLHTTTHINFPFLFMDCDALIVDSIDELNNIFQTTRDCVFFIDHETDIPNQTNMSPPFINSGVYIMNDPEHKIYNWDKIKQHAETIGYFPKFKENNKNIPGTDQAMIKSYLDAYSYNYKHPEFDIRYNTSSSMVDKNKQNYYKIIHYWGSQKQQFPYL